MHFSFQTQHLAQVPQQSLFTSHLISGAEPKIEAEVLVETCQDFGGLLSSAHYWNRARGENCHISNITSKKFKFYIRFWKAFDVWVQI